ncbi:MAG: hypothetical protein QOI40_1766, partial [Alphaproteobacteria bacterium]|nr:hypothetical protein [Alphaproteobacteria bacterium]
MADPISGLVALILTPVLPASWPL